MTTVIVDLKGRKVYSDTRCTHTKQISRGLFGIGGKTEEIFKDDFRKLWVKNKFTYACSGCVDEVSKFVYLHGSKKEFIPSSSVVVAIDSSTDEVEVYGKGYCIDDRYIVIGSGRGLAWRRMYANFTPQEAIIAASKMDKYTSDIVQVFDF